MSKLKRKKCNQCGKKKTLSCFNKCLPAKDGLQPRCRICEKKYYQKNRKRITEGFIYYNYGLKQKEKSLIYRHQKQRCPICGKRVLLKDTHVDHYHQPKHKNKKNSEISAKEKRKTVRGLLCRDCNLYIISAIDRYGEKRFLEMAKRAVEYSKNFPAQVVLDK